MIRWNFDINKQEENYQKVRWQIDHNPVWQELRYYILPSMPQKFRNRVVYYPRSCEPEKIYKWQEKRLHNIEIEFKKDLVRFEQELAKHFPELSRIDVLISPSLYGSIGWYGFYSSNTTIIVRPRYDRTLLDVEKLIVNSLTHFFYISKEVNLDKKIWIKKQKMARKIQESIFGPINKSKNMLDILDDNFSGDLAQKSINYLKELGSLRGQEVVVAKKLTKTESKIFSLLKTNINKVVSFDDLAKVIWGNSYYEKYSEYAITKHIQNIKKKISKNCIHPQRGSGYVLG